MKILVTGSAGFIGSALVLRLLNADLTVDIVGIDSLNNYYDVKLKEWRLAQIDKAASNSRVSSYQFVVGNIADKYFITELFRREKFDVVVNLAAQAGVRHSINNPDAYIESNIVGFYNILEACRHNPVNHLVYASSSSVYAGNKKVPFSEEDRVDSPESLYAATKKSNELLAHSYSKLYNIPTTGLRFFTVYGPAGRPDMAYFSFTNKLLQGDTIEIFNYGDCKRDFTYIDDVVEGIYRVIFLPPDTSTDNVPYRILNIGNEHPEQLLDFVTILQQELCRARVLPDDFDLKSQVKLVPKQPGDVDVTFASTERLFILTGFKPYTRLRDGLRRFAEWYRDYYC